MSTPSPLSQREQQNLILDAIASGRMPSRRGTLTAAASLRPGPELSFACACNNPTALALRDCWKFTHAVTELPADGFDALIERGHCTFEGRMGDRR